MGRPPIQSIVGAPHAAPTRPNNGDKTDALFLAWSVVWPDPVFHACNIEYELAAIVCPVLAL